MTKATLSGALVIDANFIAVSAHSLGLLFRDSNFIYFVNLISFVTVLETNDGKEAACDSTNTNGNPSYNDGNIKTSNACNKSATLDDLPENNTFFSIPNFFENNIYSTGEDNDTSEKKDTTSTEDKNNDSTQLEVQLEKNIGCNPLAIFGDGNKMPQITTLVAVLHASLQALEHGITLNDSYDIFDAYLADGHSLTDFIAVLVELYKVSGIIPEEKN